MTIHECNITIMVIQYKLMICLIFYSLKYLNVKLENYQSSKIHLFKETPRKNSILSCILLYISRS